MTSMSDLVNLVWRNSDFDGATVFLHKKTKSVPWRSAKCKVRTHVVFLVGQTQHFFGVAMCVSLTGLSDTVIRTDGPPIGGLLPKIAASVILLSRGTRVY